MYPKSSASSHELKKELTYDQSVDSTHTRQPMKDFTVSFKKSAADTMGALQLIPVQTIARTRQWLDWKRLAILGTALVVATALLVFLLVPRHRDTHHDQDLSSASQHYTESWDRPIQALELIEETTTTRTTTTTTTTIAPEVTTRRVLDYILASIIVNNATVPQMDKTLFSKRADAYVDLYVITGAQHQKIGRSKVDHNTMAPKWNYLFEHRLRVAPEAILQFELFDADKFNMDELIGRLYMPVRDIIADESLNGQIVGHDYDRGRLWYTVHWEPIYRYE